MDQIIKLTTGDGVIIDAYRAEPAGKPKGAIVVLQGPLGQSGEIDRTKGIQNVLARNPDVKLLAMQPGDWARNKAYSIMQDWLSRYGNQITGVIGENDDMAIGAIQAMREKGLQGKIPITSIDGIKDGTSRASRCRIWR